MVGNNGVFLLVQVLSTPRDIHAFKIGKYDKCLQRLFDIEQMYTKIKIKCISQLTFLWSKTGSKYEPKK